MAVKMPGARPKARLSAEELDRIQGALGKNYELVRGERYEELPFTVRHGEIIGEIGSRLHAWAESMEGGHILARGGFILARDPDTVRGPDVSYIRHGRMGAKHRGAFPELGPDLAVEIRSPHERWRRLEEMAREYFAAGSLMVWFVELDTFLEILRPNGERCRLGLDDVIEVDDVLPGFRCRVRDLFPEEV
jgi:Uma2 family endonuclease